MPTTSALESQAEIVAKQFASEQLANGTQSAGERGIDFITIITVIMTVVQTILQNCPQSREGKKTGIKKPTLRQRVAVFKATKETCDCMGIGRMAGSLQNAIITHGSNLADADVLAVIDETSNDNNLLI